MNRSSYNSKMLRGESPAAPAAPGAPSDAPASGPARSASSPATPADARIELEAFWSELLPLLQLQAGAAEVLISVLRETRRMIVAHCCPAAPTIGHRRWSRSFRGNQSMV